MRNFWWGQRNQESKISWVSWKKMCKSKLFGGMGFRNLHAFNLALLAKQGWRILTSPNSLVAQVYEAKYFPYDDILSAKMGSNPSYAWRSIHNSLVILNEGTRWRVGNSKRIHIWEDRWLPTPTTYKVISPPLEFGNFPMVSSLIDKDTKWWKSDLVRSIFLPFEADSILKIPISNNLPDDQLIWLGNKRGSFSVKRAYFIAMRVVDVDSNGESTTVHSQPPFWKNIWRLNVPPKVRIFAWHVCKNGLPTMLALRCRGLNSFGFCSLCDKEMESIQHALLLCLLCRGQIHQGCLVGLPSELVFHRR